VGALLKNKVRLLGLILLCFAGTGEALTLGRLRGAAVIGKTLDVVASVQLDSGEDANSLCFEADVFYADTRQMASRVRVLVEDASAQGASLRIMSLSPVDEPMVSIYLRSGCAQKSTRRYVLLADFPSEAAAPSVSAAPVLVAAGVKAPVQASVVAPQRLPVSVKKATPSAVSVAKPARRRTQGAESKQPEAKVTTAASASASMLNKNKTSQVPGQPRLKLDPLDLFSDRVASLDSFMTFAPTEDMVRTVQKMQTLESDVKALRASASLNEASLRDLKARLQAAQAAQHFPDALIYGLMAMVLVCLGAVAYLWQRQRHLHPLDQIGWAGAGAGHVLASSEAEFGYEADLVQRTGLAEQDVQAAPEFHKKGPVVEHEPLHDAGVSPEIDVSMVELSESTFDEIMREEDASHVQQHTSNASTRHLLGRGTEALIDVRHQVEFLVSLGRAERALALLKKLIHESDDPHPEIYLDLLGLLHAQGLKVDFQQTRSQFTRAFHGHIPDFFHFNEEGRTLEAYPDILARITALWPTAQAQELIENCVFQDQDNPPGEPFDLAAFRELLLLYAVAQDQMESAQADPPGGGASTPDEIKPLGLDLDLSFADSSAAQVSPCVHVDLDLPLLQVNEGGLKFEGAEPEIAMNTGDLIDFDLPDAPAPGLTDPGKSIRTGH
jgi:hypothetical protein